MKDVTLDLHEAAFLVKAQNGIVLDVDDLTQTIETWGGYNYKVGKTEVFA